MNIKKFAAIDIGSNAVRLLIMNVIPSGKNQVAFKKSSIVRVPIRLGFDSFKKNKIGKKKIDKLISLMKAYKHLMEVQEVKVFRACATSAMRDASNGSEIVEAVRKKTGIKIEIIDGSKEAEIIYATHLADYVNEEKNYLFIDVGGGSTEFTLISKGEKIKSKSFNIGTIRFLNRQITTNHIRDLEEWIKDIKNKYSEVNVIGSGGNINKYLKISGKKEGESLSTSELHKLYKHIKSFSVEERVRDLGLNPDRADVIIPAGRLFLKILEWIECDRVIVPKVGVADGIVRLLYKNPLEGQQLK